MSRFQTLLTAVAVPVGVFVTTWAATRLGLFYIHTAL